MYDYIYTVKGAVESASIANIPNEPADPRIVANFISKLVLL